MEFQVSLVFLALLSVLMSMTVSVYGTESLGEAYWKMNLGSDTNMPKVLKDTLLDGTQADVQQLSKLRSRVKLLIHANGAQANVQQHSETRTSGASLAKYLNFRGSELQNDNSVIYFIEKDLIDSRSSMKLHFVMSAGKAKFMPSEVTNSMPFSSSKLSVILKVFTVKPGSKNAKLVKETLEFCESKTLTGEEKSCETSLEGMVNYAKSKLGKQIKAISTQVNQETEQEYEIKSATKLHNEKNLVCHKIFYPYAVFYCHTLSKTDTYQVSLVDSNGKKVNAVAVCHKDTSHWNEDHIAFQLLKVKPGSVPICHFLNPDAVVWVPK